MTDQPRLTRFAWLSIAAAVVTIALKFGAFLVTGSVGLLSDALESLVNLAAAIMALAMLTVAARPPDEEHAYGHSKAEYFASSFEGALIIIAAASIAYSSAVRLMHPQPVRDPVLGIAISAAALVVNLVVAVRLLRAGRRYRSIALEADAHHLLTDVWTTVGVMAGVAAVALTGWHWLDPVIAIVVALNVVRIGIGLMRRSALGLLDTAIPEDDRATVVRILDRYAPEGAEYHALRTRQAGMRRFVSVHVLVPGEWSVQKGHELLERMEEEIRDAIPNSTVFTHLEPLEDPVSFEDVRLERLRAGRPAPVPGDSGAEGGGRRDGTQGDGDPAVEQKRANRPTGEP
ncbi:MAG TPA: cation diffusion facilitator family transporter [Longimicrobium sp.]|nr:cation diffusion facilitator family transporter [Longimicrobium sp.]